MKLVICKCSCGKEYDKDSWSDLDYLGIQRWPSSKNAELPDLEQRNCSCGSTRSVELGLLKNLECEDEK